MKRIKIMFKATDKRLEMQVVDIHESFDELRGSKEIISIDGFHLLSSYFPELTYNAIYLPGTNYSNDYRLVSRTFKSNKKRDIYIKKTNAIFAEWEKRIQNIWLYEFYDEQFIF